VEAVNLDELRPILHAYRAQAQQAWSAATAHPGYEGKVGDPAGQCGVTSAWLQRRLLEDHGIETTYCVGYVYLGFAYRSTPEHCWLELESRTYQTVLDLTAQQWDLGWPADPGLSVICAPRGLLRRRLIDYVSLKRLTAEQLLADPVQTRLAVLTESVGS
jgi:hypothetical protein